MHVTIPCLIILTLTRHSTSNCTNLPPIKHLKTDDLDLPSQVGTEITMSCQPGYQIVGDSHMVCATVNEKAFYWSTEKMPECLETSWSVIRDNVFKDYIISLKPPKGIIQIKLVEHLVPDDSCMLNFQLTFSKQNLENKAPKPNPGSLKYELDYHYVNRTISGTQSTLARLSEKLSFCPCCWDSTLPKVRLFDVITIVFNNKAVAEPNNLFYNGVPSQFECLDPTVHTKPDSAEPLFYIVVLTVNTDCKTLESVGVDKYFTLAYRTRPSDLEQITCRDSPDIKNLSDGHKKSFPLKIGQQVMFYCEDRFTMVGENRVYCKGDGELFYPGGKPRCAENYGLGLDSNEAGKSRGVNEPYDMADNKISDNVDSSDDNSVKWFKILLLSNLIALCLMLFFVHRRIVKIIEQKKTMELNEPETEEMEETEEAPLIDMDSMEDTIPPVPSSDTVSRLVMITQLERNMELPEPESSDTAWSDDMEDIVPSASPVARRPMPPRKAKTRAAQQGEKQDGDDYRKSPVEKYTTI